MKSIIVIMTDFGLQDTYVGIMKGVMLKICPSIEFIDLTHHVPPQNVRQAAFMLMNAYTYFPDGTIFLVVVDPGVGSTRRPIAIKTSRYTFIAPDNGVLSYLLMNEQEITIVELSNPHYQLSDRSNTFHGRDIFAPVAAYLALEIPFQELGKPADSYMQLPIPQLYADRNRIVGEVIAIDHFGNIITSIGRLKWLSGERLTLIPALAKDLMDLPIKSQEAVIHIAGEQLISLHITYSESQRGELLALVGSSGYLEVAMNQGNAAQRLEITVGDQVELELGDRHATIYH